MSDILPRRHQFRAVVQTLVVCLGVLPFLRGAGDRTADGGETARTWTSTDGRVVSATFVRLDGDAVLIHRTSDNREFSIPLSQLSVQDREYVRQRVDAPEAATPSAPGDPAPMSENLLTGKWEAATFRDRKGQPRVVHVLGPAAAADGGSYPLVLFVRGRGSFEDPPPESSGIRHFVSPERFAKHPCIVIKRAPAFDPDPRKDLGSNDCARLLELAATTLPIDEGRIYLAGTLNGTLTVSNLVSSHSDRIAACVVTSGITVTAANQDMPEAIVAPLAIWGVTGVAPEGSGRGALRNQRLLDFLHRARDLGADVVIEDRDIGQYDLEEDVFSDPDVHEWLFRQAKTR